MGRSFYNLNTKFPLPESFSSKLENDQRSSTCWLADFSFNSQRGMNERLEESHTRNILSLFRFNFAQLRLQLPSRPGNQALGAFVSSYAVLNAREIRFYNFRDNFNYVLHVIQTNPRLAVWFGEWGIQNQRGPLGGAQFFSSLTGLSKKHRRTNDEYVQTSRFSVHF